MAQTDRETSIEREMVLIRELLEKDIEHIKEKMSDVEEHLKKMNGQIIKNTAFSTAHKTLLEEIKLNSEFRKKHKIIYGILAFIASCIGAFIGFISAVRGIFVK